MTKSSKVAAAALILATTASQPSSMVQSFTPPSRSSSHRQALQPSTTLLKTTNVRNQKTIIIYRNRRQGGSSVSHVAGGEALCPPLRMSYYVAPNNEDDEAMIQSILGPMGQKRKGKRGRSILILSDTTGVTAKSAVEKGLAQFNGCDERFLSADENGEDPCELMQKNLYPFIKKPEEIAPIIEKAQQRNSMVVSTYSSYLS